MEIYFGNNLKFLRTSKGLNQSEMGEIMSLKKSMVGRYEAGDSQPDLETLVTIAHYFNVEIDALIKEDISTISGIEVLNSSQKQKRRSQYQPFSEKTGKRNELNMEECQKLLLAKEEVIAAQQKTIELYERLLNNK